MREAVRRRAHVNVVFCERVIEHVGHQNNDHASEGTPSKDTDTSSKSQSTVSHNTVTHLYRKTSAIVSLTGEKNTPENSQNRCATAYASPLHCTSARRAPHSSQYTSPTASG